MTSSANTKPDPVVGSELFLRNMRALWHSDPELALLVDAVHDDERIPLEPTRSESWTAKVQTPQGTATYLHSRYDPEAEAETLVSAFEIEDKFCFVVSGLGLGHHVLALFRRLRGDAFIVCVEPSITLIATALSCVDLAEPMNSGRLIYLTDDDKTCLHRKLKDRSTLLMLGAQFVQHPPSMRVAEQEHLAVSAAISEFVTFTRMSLITLISNSKITCRNIAMNAVNYVSTPPVDILQNRFAGNPALIVSAGPSLAKNIDLIGAMKGRAVICAVQTAVRPLMEREIVPDFITSLDFHEMSRKFFDDVGDLSGTHLVAEPKATWHVVDRFPGMVSLLDNAWARMLLGDDLAARGGLKAGATVSHLAFYLAVHMGCDPIIFVGQDLAFTGHVFYIPGVEIHKAWRSELNRFNTIEHKEWDRIVRNRPILRKVPAAEGGTLYTDELLLTYLEQFEKDIAAVPQRVINATEGGANIRGTDVMTLAAADRLCCADTIDPERFAYRNTVRRRDSKNLAATRTALTERVDELKAAGTMCEEVLGLLHELEGLTDDPPRFNQRLVRVDELRALIHQESRAYQLVNAYSQQAELRRYSADRKISGLEADAAERAKQQIARDIDFITAVRDGASELEPIIRDALARVVEAGEQQ